MNEQQIRVDLAAAFRLLVHFDMHEAVANHLSAAISEDGKTFLMNRRWMHFADVSASNLQTFNSSDDSIMHAAQAPDPSAWAIHGQIHKHLPQAKVILHAHPTYATALATLKDPTIYPIDNNTARYYHRVAYDLNFGGIATEQQEGERISQVFQEKSVLMMANHGVTILGETVAQPLHILSPELAEQTAAGWIEFRGAADQHFTYLKSWLDQHDPGYKD